MLYAQPRFCFVVLLRDDELAKDVESAEASERPSSMCNKVYYQTRT